jgi:hypothetical protein
MHFEGKMMRTSIFRMLGTFFGVAVCLMGCATQETEVQGAANPSTTKEASLAQATATATPTKAIKEGTPSAKTCEGKEECDAGCLYKDQHGKPLAAAKTVSAEEEAACPHEQQARAKGNIATVKDHFGAAFTLNKSLPLSKVLQDATNSPSSVMQVTGTIDAVCQKKGCWMVIKDGEATARVLMKNHSFAIPIGAKGKEAVVEGALKVRTFSEAQVKHLEADRGGDPNKVSGTRREYVLTASGVRISS